MFAGVIAASGERAVSSQTGLWLGCSVCRHSCDVIIFRRSLAIGTKAGYKLFSLSSVEQLDQVHGSSKYTCMGMCVHVCLCLCVSVCLSVCLSMCVYLVEGTPHPPLRHQSFLVLFLIFFLEFWGLNPLVSLKHPTTKGMPQP